LIIASYRNPVCVRRTGRDESFRSDEKKTITRAGDTGFDLCTGHFPAGRRRVTRRGRGRAFHSAQKAPTCKMLFRVKRGYWKTGAPHRFLHEACPGLNSGVEMTEGVILGPESRSGEVLRGGVEESVLQQGVECRNHTLRCLRSQFRLSATRKMLGS